MLSVKIVQSVKLAHLICPSVQNLTHNLMAGDIHQYFLQLQLTTSQVPITPPVSLTLDNLFSIHLWSQSSSTDSWRWIWISPSPISSLFKTSFVEPKLKYWLVDINRSYYQQSVPGPSLLCSKPHLWSQSSSTGSWRLLPAVSLTPAPLKIRSSIHTHSLRQPQQAFLKQPSLTKG